MGQSTMCLGWWEAEKLPQGVIHRLARANVDSRICYLPLASCHHEMTYRIGHNSGRVGETQDSPGRNNNTHTAELSCDNQTIQ